MKSNISKNRNDSFIHRVEAYHFTVAVDKDHRFHDYQALKLIHDDILSIDDISNIIFCCILHIMLSNTR